jgi:hypothetical protein
VIIAFVDHSFGTDPVQLACGKLDKVLAPPARRDSDDAKFIEINPNNGPD